MNEMNEVIEIQSQPQQNYLTIDAIQSRQKMIDSLISSEFKNGLHFGTIPGTPKPTLYQPGAQLFNTMFQVFPQYKTDTTYLQNNHISVTSVCTLHTLEGKLVGSGSGLCSSMESKYRYVNDSENTGQLVPKVYWTHKDNGDMEKAIESIGGKGFCARKSPEDNQWYVYKVSGKTERQDMADVWNTIIKMANKRAYIDATNNTWALSGRFTQDIGDPEDQGENVDQKNKKKEQPKPTSIEALYIAVESKKDEIAKALKMDDIEIGKLHELTKELWDRDMRGKYDHIPKTEAEWKTVFALFEQRFEPAA